MENVFDIYTKSMFNESAWKESSPLRQISFQIAGKIWLDIFKFHRPTCRRTKSRVSQRYRNSRKDGCFCSKTLKVKQNIYISVGVETKFY